MQIGKVMAISSAVLLAHVEAVASQLYQYGQPSEPLAESATANVGAAEASGIAAYLKSPDVTQTLTGESMALDANAAMKVSGGTLRLEVPFSAAGASVLTNDAGDIVFALDDPETQDWIAAAPGWTMLYENLDVADIDVVSSRLQKGMKTSGEGLYRAYCQARVDGGLEAQLQMDAGTRIKALKIRLEQDGANVKGQIVWARHFVEGKLGDDLDQLEPTGNYTIMQRYGDTQGLGLTELNVRRQNGVLEFVKPVTAVGAVTVRDRTILRLTGDQVADAQGDWTVSTDIRGVGQEYGAGGTLAVRDVPSVRLTGSVKGSYGNFLVERTAASAAETATSQIDIAIADAKAYNSWTLVAANLALSALTGVENVYMGGTSYSTTPSLVETYFFRNNGGTASVMAQGGVNLKGTGVNKCCLIEFRQCPEGIKMRVKKTFYRRDWYNDGKGYEYDGYNHSGSGTVGDTTYKITQLRLVFKEGTCPWYRTTLASSDNSWPRSTIRVAGAEKRLQMLELSQKPYSYGRIEVKANGLLLTTSTTGDLNNSTTCVHSCGVWLANRQTLGTPGGIVLDGGVMVAAADKDGDPDANNDTYNYLNDVTLRNGARIVHQRIRAGFGANVATLVVGGSSPSFVDTPIALCSRASGVSSVWRMTVADTTGDGLGTPDVTFAEGFGLYNANYAGISVEKYGAGTVLMNGLNTYTQPTTIYEGAIKLGRNNTMKSTMPVVLAGGTLAAAANTTNTVGAVTVTASSALVLDAGAELNIPQPAEWAADVRLSVTQGEGSVFRIGTSACLDAATLRRVKVNGRRVVQNDDGSFSPSGMAILVR